MGLLDSPVLVEHVHFVGILFMYTVIGQIKVLINSSFSWTSVLKVTILTENTFGNTIGFTWNIVKLSIFHWLVQLYLISWSQYHPVGTQYHPWIMSLYLWLPRKSEKSNFKVFYSFWHDLRLVNVFLLS